MGKCLNVTKYVLACFCIGALIAMAVVGGISKIVMGALHLHDCSIQRLIPIWLIVSGCAPILSGLGKNNDDKCENKSSGIACARLLFAFSFAWLICGSVWVYPNYGKVTADDFNPCTGNVTPGCSHGDCNKGLITFAYAMATTDWICFGLLIVVNCCCGYTSWNEVGV